MISVSGKLVCFVVALVFFFLSGLSIPVHPRINAQGVGAFFLTLALALPG